MFYYVTRLSIPQDVRRHGEALANKLRLEFQQQHDQIMQLMQNQATESKSSYYRHLLMFDV